MLTRLERIAIINSEVDDIVENLSNQAEVNKAGVRLHTKIKAIKDELKVNGTKEEKEALLVVTKRLLEEVFLVSVTYNPQTRTLSQEIEHQHEA